MTGKQDPCEKAVNNEITVDTKHDSLQNMPQWYWIIWQNVTT